MTSTMLSAVRRLTSGEAHRSRLPPAHASVHAPPCRVPYRCPYATTSAERESPSTSYDAIDRILLQRSHRLRCLSTATDTGPAHYSRVDGKVGVVIVDHGSRKKASNEMLVEFGRLYGDLTGQDIVEIAHMEIASPTIEDAVGRCAARGATTVVVAPYFLSRGRHIQEDIPELVRQAQQRHPGLQCIIAEPIGIDPLMVQLISNRVASAMEAAPTAAAATAGCDGVPVAAGSAAGAGCNE